MRYIETVRGRLVAASLSTLLIASCFTQHAQAAQSGYVVQAGDTLSGIAARFGTTVPALISANNLSDPSVIVIGQTLVITGAAPAPATVTSGISVVYIVHPGDTLSGIGNQFGVPFESLASLNSLAAPYVIRTGQTLMIPATSDNPAAAVMQPAVSVGTPNTAPVTGGVVYAVQQGDTLSALANRFGVTADAIASANQLPQISLITIGQQLIIPAVGSTATASSAGLVSTAGAASQNGSYVVQAGDTLSAIAVRYGMTTGALAAQNNISTDAVIAVGQQLVVPSVALTSGQEPFVDQATIAAILTTEAQRAGLDPALVKALAWQESGWQMVTASDGGMGVMQLMPDSVTWAGGTLLGQTIDPFNATDNIRAGVAMLSYYLKVYGGDVRKALAAYHQGMASVDNEGIRPDTEQYIANILALQQQYGG